MTKQTVRAGDIFVIADTQLHGEILALDKQIRLGKVIFKSKRTRAMIAMLISENTFSEIPANVSNIKFVDNVFYSLYHHVRNGAWQIIGRQPVTEHEEDLTLRLVGSTLYRLDEDLGVIADKKERKKYPKQLLCYLGAIYIRINQFVKENNL